MYTNMLRRGMLVKLFLFASLCFSLLSAVTSNNIRILQVLVATPQTLRDGDIDLGLQQACKLGYVECVQCLLAAGADREARDNGGNAPLYLAVQSNHPDVVIALIEAKCSVNTRGCGGNTPLHVASKWGYDECLQTLLDNGANVNACDSSGATPLIVAVRNGQYMAVRAILQLERGVCDLDLYDSEGRTALHYASYKARCVDQLVAAGANLNITDNDNLTPLIMAATEGFDKVITTLLHAGRKCDVNVASKSVQRTALHHVAYKGHTKAVSALIYAGADVNKMDSQSHTPLWYAIKNARLEVVKLLLRANSQVDSFQCPPLAPIDACPTRLAVTLGQVSVVKLFLLTGFDKAHVQEALRDMDVVQRIFVNDDVNRWKHHIHGALTLKQICRQGIRHRLGTLLYHDLSCLPLPDPMKDYLTMKELDDGHLD
jgi:ankyrin repeat protein